MSRLGLTRNIDDGESKQRQGDRTPVDIDPANTQHHPLLRRGFILTPYTITAYSSEEV